MPEVFLNKRERERDVKRRDLENERNCRRREGEKGKGEFKLVFNSWRWIYSFFFFLLNRLILI